MESRRLVATSDISLVWYTHTNVVHIHTHSHLQNMHQQKCLKLVHDIHLLYTSKSFVYYKYVYKMLNSPDDVRGASLYACAT